METKEERRRRLNRAAARRYRQRLQTKIKNGDPAAIKQQQKNNNSKSFTAAKSFVKLHASRQQLAELSRLISKRLKEFYKNKQESLNMIHE